MVDTRLAELCLWGRGPFRRPPPLEALEVCFWMSKIKVIFGWLFEASPHATKGFGHVFLGQHHQHNWAFVFHFGHLNISRVLEGS